MYIRTYTYVSRQVFNQLDIVYTQLYNYYVTSHLATYTYIIGEYLLKYKITDWQQQSSYLLGSYTVTTYVYVEQPIIATGTQVEICAKVMHEKVRMQLQFFLIIITTILIHYNLHVCTQLHSCVHSYIHMQLCSVTVVRTLKYITRQPVSYSCNIPVLGSTWVRAQQLVQQIQNSLVQSTLCYFELRKFFQ